MAEEGVTRTERLLALLVLHNLAEASQVEKCVQLDRVGFSHAEIAELVSTSTATVTQNLYAARQSKGRKPSRKATRRAPRKAARANTKKRGR